MDEEAIVGAFVSSLTPPPAKDNPAKEPVVSEAEVEDKKEAPAKDSEVKAEEEQDAETIEIDPDEPLFEQEIDEDGKKVAKRLSLKELQQGYLLQKDYTRKTQDLARQREELPKLVAKQAQELSESYGKRLSELTGLVMKTVAADIQGVDLNKLATEDPFEYVRVSNRSRQINELLQQIQAEQTTEKTKAEEEKNKKTSEQWQKSLEVLNRDIPDFGPAVVTRIIESGEKWGFTKDEVSKWSDHRMIKMLHELSSRAEVTSKKPEVEKKVALVTKVLKPGQSQQKSTVLDDARKRLAKSGKDEDALPIFEAMLARR